MNQLTQAGAPVEGSRAQDAVALESHSYSGGLRVQLLGKSAARPDWVPPSDYVGFRNEFGLLPGDYVVEFARFAYRSRKVTWVAVFGHAVDEVYGDRQNHAGVGVWLLDQDVLYAEPLLKSLRGFADLARKGENLDPRADDFREGFLPDFLQPSLNLPSALHGWAFVAGPVADTAMFVATNGGEADGWGLAADQLLRATLLPPPTPGHSRALILVRLAEQPDSTPDGLKPIVPLATPEIIKVLPQALAKVADENRSAQMRLGDLSERCRGLEAELASERSGSTAQREQAAQLQDQVDKLRAELDGNDQHRQWSAIKAQMRDVADQTVRNATLIENARREVLRGLSTLQAVGTGHSHRSEQKQEPHKGQPTSVDSDEAWTRSERIVFWVIAAVAAGVIMTIGYILYSQASTPAVSSVTQVDDPSAG